MQNFVNFIKENYSYFVYAFEFIFALVGAVIAFVKSRRSSDLETENRLLSNKFSYQVKKNNYLGLLPTMVRAANILYPIHGDGAKRFEYVYQNVLRLLGRECDTPVFRSEVYFAVESILHADKLEKISRDTQVIEPKKEFVYEKAENASEEGSEGLLQNVQKDEIDQSCTCYVPRRS